MAIESELEMVYFAVPGGGFGGIERELVGVEEESESLDPCEVSGTTSGSVANEPTIDLKVRVRDEAEFFIALSMEVEHNAVSSNEPRVITS